MPILDNIQAACDLYKNSKLHPILNRAVQDIKNGMLLSEALSYHPKIFNTFFVQVVAVSEKTGRLYHGFEQLVHHLKWVDTSRAQIVKTTRYPLIVACMVVCLFWVLMNFLVPQLVNFITTPSPLTNSLIHTSAFVSQWGTHTLYSTILVVGITIALKKLVPGFAKLFARLIVIIPVFGALYKKIILTRFIHFFKVTFESGIDILQCLQLSLQATQNHFLRVRLATIGEHVNMGLSLTQAFEASNLFSATTVRMIKVGEASGDLNKMLQNLHYLHDQDVNREIEKYIGLAEPALFIIIGMLMLWIVTGAFYPIYDNLSVLEY